MRKAHTPLTRRDFLKIAGATLGGAALACVRSQTPVSVTAIRAPTATPLPAPALAPGGSAQAVLFNGRVVAIDRQNTLASAIAIQDGRILQLGDDDTLRALAGPATNVIDLRGRTATPGMIDAHNHLHAVGLIGTAYIDVRPPGVATIADLQAEIAEGVAKSGPGDWVIAAGVIALEGRFPDKNDLDPVSPENPVMVINMGGHVGAVNSFALALANVTAATPDPPFGQFRRDERGEPDGVVVNHSAMDYFRRLWPDDVLSPETLEQAILTPQAEFAAAGITSFQDVNVRGVDKMKTYFKVAREGKMSLRAYLLNTIEYYQELEGRTDEIDAMLYEDDYMQFGGYKFLVDGAGTAAYTHEPHSGLAWNIATWKPDQLKEAVAALHEAGYQCGFHVIGDAAVDMALDAIEYAMNKAPRPDPRHRLEHAVLNTDAALQRTKDLGVIVSAQPQMIRLLGDYLDTIWGSERASRMVPTRSWLDMGVPLALGSDAPTMPFYLPQMALATAIARLTLSDRVLGPEEALTIEEALYAHTMGSAYAAFQENLKGSLEPGKMGDVIVWADDPYSATPVELWSAKIDLTMVGGKVLYQA